MRDNKELLLYCTASLDILPDHFVKEEMWLFYQILSRVKYRNSVTLTFIGEYFLGGEVTVVLCNI